jgi:hypothetical protein
MNIFRCITFAVAFLLAVEPATAQWQTANHSTPVGRGPGVTGFGSVGPCAAGQAIIGQGASADPMCGVPFGAPNIQTANYTIATTDCAGTVQSGTGSTGFLTISLPAASGVPEGCAVRVKNGDSGRGKLLSGFPADFATDSILWPLQAGGVMRVNGVWVSIFPPGPWVLSSAVTMHTDYTNGVDAPNDCLGTLAGACKTVTNAAALFCRDMVKNGQTFAIVATGGNQNENLNLCAYRQTELLAQSSAPTITATFTPATGTAVTAVNVNTPWTLLNSTFQVANTSTVCVEADRGSLLYINNATFFTCGIVMQMLFGGTIELSGTGSTLRSNVASVVQTSVLAQFISAGLSITCTGVGAISGSWAQAQSNSAQNWAGSTFPGCGSVTGTRYTALTGGGIDTGGGGASFFLPGGSAGTATAPGWYN